MSALEVEPLTGAELTPQEQEHADFVVNSGSRAIGVAAALGGAFLVYRMFMQRKLKERYAGREALTTGELISGAQKLYSLYLPHWLAMTVPVVMTGLHAGALETDYVLTDDVLRATAEQYARGLGDHINDVSVDSISKGYGMLLNRKIPAKFALANMIDAFGATHRGIRTAVVLITGKEDIRLSDVVMPSVKRMRIRRAIETAVNGRAEMIGETESWTAKEQGKQIAWLYALKQGLLPATATRRWVTADDERVCPICGPMDEVRVPVDEKFLVSDYEIWAPPVHPNCRCFVEMEDREISKSENDWETQPRTRSGRFGYRPDVAVAMAPPPPKEPEAQVQGQLKPIQARPGIVAKPVQGIKAVAGPPAIAARYTAPPAIRAKVDTPPVIAAAPKIVAAVAPPAIKVEEQPIEAVAEEAAPEVDEDAAAEAAAWTAPEPRIQANMFHLERPVYGVTWGEDFSAGEITQVEDVYFTDDLQSLRLHADQFLNNEVDSYLDERLGMYGDLQGTEPGWTEDGIEMLIDYDTLSAGLEWLMARRNYEVAVITGTDETYPIVHDPAATVTMQGRDLATGKIEEYEVPITDLVRRTGLTGDFEEMLPKIFRLDTVNLDKVDGGGDSPDGSSNFETWGKHHVVQSHVPLVDENGDPLPFDVWEIEPVDEDYDDPQVDDE